MANKFVGSRDARETCLPQFFGSIPNDSHSLINEYYDVVRDPGDVFNALTVCYCFLNHLFTLTMLLTLMILTRCLCLCVSSIAGLFSLSASAFVRREMYARGVKKVFHWKMLLFHRHAIHSVCNARIFTCGSHLIGFKTTGFLYDTQNKMAQNACNFVSLYFKMRITFPPSNTVLFFYIEIH